MYIISHTHTHIYIHHAHPITALNIQIMSYHRTTTSNGLATATEGALKHAGGVLMEGRPRNIMLIWLRGRGILNGKP